MSSEVSCSDIGPKRLDNITYSGNRNIIVPGERLEALRFSMLGYNLHPV